VIEFWSVVTHPASAGGPSTAGHGATEIWTHDGGFVALPGLVVRDPLV